MIEEHEKYIDCSVCGISILEQCAIEEHGKFMCGDCIVNITQKEVIVAEKISKDKREKEYEEERKKLVLKKKKQGVLVLLLLLIILVLALFTMKSNQPEPVNSIIIDYSKDLYAAKSLITIGIYKYTAEKEQLPITLNDLIPHYLPKGVDKVFHSFKYLKLNNDHYELEIILLPSVSQFGVNDEE